METQRLAAEAASAARRERRQRERLESLVSMTDATIGAPTADALMESVVQAAVPRLGEWCILQFVPEAGAQMPQHVAHADPDQAEVARQVLRRHPFVPVGRIGIPAVLRTGLAELIVDVDESTLEALAQSTSQPDAVRPVLATARLRSLITVPLTTKRGVIGALQLVRTDAGPPFDTDDLALARLAAGRVAEALDNIWLLEQHRQISAELQRSLLPPALPTLARAEVAARYWPAGAVAEVGGDFYDVFGLADDRWAVVIGDVCGTGPNAAAVSGIVRHTIRAAARHGHDHRTVLAWINEAVRESGRHLFCTTCYATLDANPTGHVLTVAAGGHPLPLVVRASGEAQALGRPGTLLGVFEHVNSHPRSTELLPGDVVVFYTDGISDLPPPHLLTPEQVTELIVGAAQHGSAEAIADAIHADLERRLPLARREDDIALLVVRVTG
jgi:serine phosphatase RsbU (regulator of sigma subunit)